LPTNRQQPTSSKRKGQHMFVKAGTTILQALLLACVFALVQPGDVRANPIFNNSFEDGLNDWSSSADGRFGRNAEPSAYDGLPTEERHPAASFRRHGRPSPPASSDPCRRPSI
jgi:hypothetical protein